MDSTNGPVEPLVDISAFSASDIRVGTILEASPFEGARRPAYVIQIDFAFWNTLEVIVVLGCDILSACS